MVQIGINSTQIHFRVQSHSRTQTWRAVIFSICLRVTRRSWCNCNDNWLKMWYAQITLANLRWWDLHFELLDLKIAQELRKFCRFLFAFLQQKSDACLGPNTTLRVIRIFVLIEGQKLTSRNVLQPHTQSLKLKKSNFETDVVLWPSAAVSQRRQQRCAVILTIFWHTVDCLAQVGNVWCVCSKGSAVAYVVIRN